MIILLGGVSRVAGFSFSACCLYHTTPLWLAKFLQRNQLITLWGFPCKWLFVFLLLTSNFFLNFAMLVMICLGVSLFGFTCLGFPVLLVPGYVSFFRLRRFSAISSDTLLNHICLSSPSGTPVIQMWVCLISS